MTVSEVCGMKLHKIQSVTLGEADFSVNHDAIFEFRALGYMRPVLSCPYLQ